MSRAVVLGAGGFGAAITHKLAERGRFQAVCLIDDRADRAAGLALDIRQAGPVDGFDTAVTSSADVLAAAGADVIVVADRADAGEWEGDAGLALVGRLARAGTKAPFVFAGAKAAWLMEAAVRELKLPADRLVGTAASAMVGVARALVGLELDGSAVDVDLVVAGRPPGLVVAWSSATVAGSLVTDRLPAHRLLAISGSLGRLWPPGPQAVAAATAPIAEALAFGSRRRHQAMTLVAGNEGTPHVAVMLPLRLGRGRVLGHEMPSLSPKERTSLGV